jgi:hypothetical protein
MQQAEDSWAWDAHAGSGGSTTELSVTEYYQGRGGDVKIYREVSEAVCPINRLRPLPNSNWTTKGQKNPVPLIREVRQAD